MKILLSIALIITIATGQFNYSGSMKPRNMYRLSGQSEISLPFRLLQTEIGYSWRDFELKTNTALEYRWSNNENKLQLREAYLIWFPHWGELKIGQQIHAWGVVDSNNPTDNLNPYDYYYMFLAGTDRKIGTKSASINLYWDDWQIEGVLIPQHEGNRLPFGEEDFPIMMNDPGDLLKKVKQGNEYGFHMQRTVGNSDLSLSYFMGRDRGFTHSGYNSVLGMDKKVSPVFVFRKTNVIGIEIVTFIGDASTRIETGYYKTDNDYETNFSILKDASYLQYALQLEYTTSNDMMMMSQIFGNEILKVNGTGFVFDPYGTATKTSMTEDDFQPGMGMPFSIFTNMGMTLSITANYLDNTLELRGNIFSDLTDTQSMLGCGLSYSFIENWNLELSTTYFVGADGTRFKEIEEFSHIRLGLKFHY